MTDFFFETLRALPNISLEVACFTGLKSGTCSGIAFFFFSLPILLDFLKERKKCGIINIREKKKISLLIIMSLVILSSKGSDSEDFTNYMTQGIEFPKDSEVCLVQSHINRRLLVDSEIAIDAGNNQMGFQFGLGDLTTDRNAAGYTPHSPQIFNWEAGDKMFPIYYNTIGLLELGIDDVLNDPAKQNITPLVGACQSDVPIVAPSILKLFSQFKVPTAGESLGSTVAGKVIIQPGDQGGDGIIVDTGINDEAAILEYAAPVQMAGAGFAGWVNLESTGIKEEACGYVDTTPLLNTDTGSRPTVFALEATGVNLAGGGWNWQFDAASITARLEVMKACGGILSANSYVRMNTTEAGSNSNENGMTGGTDFCCWWKVIAFDSTTGQGEAHFYARKITPGVKRFQEEDQYQWGSARWGATTESVRIGMRPVQGTGVSAGKYIIEGYAAIVTTATNAVVGAVINATAGGAQPGYIEVSDPLNTTVPATGQPQFNLYRHLPLRMGINMPDAIEFQINAVHHQEMTGNMLVPTQTSSPPLSFSFNKIRGLQTVDHDQFFYPVIQKSTIGDALGFQLSTYSQTAALLIPGGTAIEAEIPVNAVIPMNHSLVVTLPDLPISGFYGNSTGSGAAGTLGINSGGTSAAILGVIPFGEAPLRYDPTDDYMGARGQFYASPMENWIKLKNPQPFTLTSLRVKLTDELGNKPRCCTNNTTITIKIKKPNGGENAKLTVQG